MAILLLAIYLFNLVGYHLMFSLIIRQSDHALLQQLDHNHYNDEDLVQIKIPMNLPYYTSQPSYERVRGEVCYKGVYYSYVKRRVSNDTLYILCVANQTKTRLNGAHNDYAKKANDLPSDKQNFAKKTGNLSDHNSPGIVYSFALTPQSPNPSVYHFASRLHSAFSDDNFRPPQIGA